MNRIFVFFVLVVLSVGCGLWAVGGAAAQADEPNETAGNESIEWPTDRANVSVEDVRDALEEPPEQVPTETIRAVAAWASNPQNIRELGASERDRLTRWIDEARSSEEIEGALNTPDLPDLPDRDGGDGDDRGDEQEDEPDEPDEPNESAGELEDDGRVAEFDNGAVITDYDFRDGYVWVSVDADRRTSVEIADSLAGIDQDGATEIPVETEAVRPGGGTVNAPVTEFNGGHSVTVTIDGQSVRLSTEMDEQTGENPLAYFGGTNGLFSGIGITVALALSAAGFVLWREDNGVSKA